MEGDDVLDATDDASAGDEGDAPRRSTIDRRNAMKIALGGAAAATVWSAPRVEGLSLAPDYAAAASCNAVSTAPQFVKNSNNCGYYGDTECWGNNCCEPAGWSRTVNAGTKNFAFNGNIGGGVNTDDGFVNIATNSIDPPFQSCRVVVSGNCNNGGTFRGGGTYNFNNNGSQQSFIDCQGGGNFLSAEADGTVRIDVTCFCR